MRFLVEKNSDTLEDKLINEIKDFVKRVIEIIKTND